MVRRSFIIGALFIIVKFTLVPVTCGRLLWSTIARTCPVAEAMALMLTRVTPVSCTEICCGSGSAHLAGGSACEASTWGFLWDCFCREGLAMACRSLSLHLEMTQSVSAKVCPSFVLCSTGFAIQTRCATNVFQASSGACHTSPAPQRQVSGRAVDIRAAW